MHLRQKRPIAYTAVEQYVSDQIKCGQIAWFPVGQSLSLQAGREKSVRKACLLKVETTLQTAVIAISGSLLIVFFCLNFRTCGWMCTFPCLCVCLVDAHGMTCDGV